MKGAKLYPPKVYRSEFLKFSLLSIKDGQDYIIHRNDLAIIFAEPK